MPTTTPASSKSLAELYATMALIRALETRVAELYRDGEIPGFVHTSLGQEAIAAGVCGALEASDYMTTTHRGHGHVLAKGADLDGMVAEQLGRRVAVKVLRPELADDPEAVARLLGERDVLTGIDSPHLVPVRDDHRVHRRRSVDQRGWMERVDVRPRS